MYGEYAGVRTARKHIAWYVRDLPGGEVFRQQMNQIEDSHTQFDAVTHYFDQLAVQYERLPQVKDEASSIKLNTELQIYI